MRRGFILNLVILLFLLLLAFLPWLLMLNIESQSVANNCPPGSGSPPPGYCGELYSYGFGLGLLGSVTTPILLGITAFYILVVILLFLFQWNRSRNSGKPVPQFLRGMMWSTVATIGVALLGTAGILVVNWYQVSFISACKGLPSVAIQSNRNNGDLALAVKLTEPRGTLQQYAILTVTPEGEETGIVTRLPGSRDPAWSPDGKQLAFVAQPESDKEWSLFISDATGQFPQTVITGNLEISKPTWTPDGTELMIRRWLEPSGNPDHEIFLVDLKSVTQERIPGGKTFDGDMQVSPDGNQIVFVSDRNNTNDIYVMNMDGSNVRQLTFNSSMEIDPDWSPDGKWIVFSSNRESSPVKNNYNLYIMAPDGTNQCQLTNGEGSEWHPVWSPDGQWIAYISLLDSKAKIIRPDGTGEKAIELNRPLSDMLSLDWKPK